MYGKRLNVCCSSRLAEARGLKGALLWIQGQSRGRIWIEMNSKIVMDGFKSRKLLMQSLARIFFDCHVSFIKRQVNALADVLSKAAFD
ncbi:hypothetical protein M5689_003861 [Euphorbia peplus]|nr:hypothetical protein M5689_003861 [Euphorbia peplus]